MGSDVEMRDVDQDSLASTAESEARSSYEIEEILAERKQNGRMLYLIKWLGYPEHRSDWEPKENFNSKETLAEWNLKKGQIRAKRLAAFDVKAFEKDQIRRLKETAERKQARRIRRDQRLKKSLFDDDESSDHAARKPQEDDDNDDDDVMDDNESTFVDADDAISINSSSKNSDDQPEVADSPITPIQPHLDTAQALPSGAAASDEIPNSAKDSQITAKSSGGVTRVPPQNGTETASSRPPPALSGFGDASTAPVRVSTKYTNTKWFGRESRWGRDRAPDASELHLLKPTEFTPLKGPPKTAPPPDHVGDTMQEPPEDSSPWPNHLRDLSQGQSSLDKSQVTTGSPIRPKPRSLTLDNESSDLSSQTTGSESFSQAGNGSGQNSMVGLTRASGIRPSGIRSRYDSYRPSDTQVRPRADSYRPSVPPPRGHIRNRSLSPPSSLSPETSALVDSPRSNLRVSQPSVRRDRVRSDRMQTREHFPSNTPKPGQELQAPRCSDEELISRMPVGDPTTSARAPSSRYLSKGRFWNIGELYVQVFYGPARTPVGDLRICDLPFELRAELLTSKPDKRSGLEMWFKDTCDVLQYATLCEGASRNVPLGNYWMERFRDNNADLFGMGKYLQQHNVMAIFYPRDPGNNVHLVYSRMSPDFDFLNWDIEKVPTWTPLIWAVRSALPPVSSLSALQNIPMDIDPMTSGDIFTEGEESLNSPREVQKISKGSQQSEAYDGSSNPTANIANQDVEKALRQFFGSYLKISLKHLSTLSDRRSRAENFFLHFPRGQEEDEEFQYMKNWLGYNGMIVYSNRDEDGWSRFLDNSKRGVVIFHESFTDFHLLRPVIGKSLLMRETFNVWRVRLKGKLEHMHPRGIYHGDHCQSIFPSGSLILVAEDIFRDLRTTAVLVGWLSIFSKQHKDWKLVLPPNAWNRLKEKLRQTKSKEESHLLLAIITWIKKINSIDELHPFFNEQSLNPSRIYERNSNILSLDVPGYGSRSEQNYPVLPKGLSQQERDMDHLAEAFAGWTLTQTARFRRMIIVSSVELRLLRERWKSWGHIILYMPSDLFRIFLIKEHVILNRMLGERFSQSVNSPAENSSTPNRSSPNKPAAPANTPADVQQGDHWTRPSEVRQAE